MFQDCDAKSIQSRHLNFVTRRFEEMTKFYHACIHPFYYFHDFVNVMPLYPLIREMFSCLLLFHMSTQKRIKRWTVMTVDKCRGDILFKANGGGRIRVDIRSIIAATAIFETNSILRSFVVIGRYLGNDLPLRTSNNQVDMSQFIT